MQVRVHIDVGKFCVPFQTLRSIRLKLMLKKILPSALFEGGGGSADFQLGQRTNNYKIKM